MAKIVIGCNHKKNCENPYGCCSTCHIGFRNCENPDEQCDEVPDTCDLMILEDENKMICDNKSCNMECSHKKPHRYNEGCKIICHNYPEAKCIKF